VLVDAIIALIDGDSLVWDMVVTELDQTDDGLYVIRPITLNYPDYDREGIGTRPTQPMRMRVLLPVIEFGVDDEPGPGMNIQVQPGLLASTHDKDEKDSEVHEDAGQ
jgi:hypothetical protein